MNSSARIAKCPACGAKTKVSPDPDRVSIRCPRCKADVPLVHAVPYASGAKAVGDAVAAEPGAPSETKRLIPTPEPRSSRRRGAATGATEFSYPDFARRFTRLALVVAGGVVLVVLLLVVYQAWSNSTNDRYQAYLKNLRESIAAYEKCRDFVKQGFDPNDTKKRQEYQETKGQIEFLLSQRKRLEAPPAHLTRELREEEQSVRQQWIDAEHHAQAAVLPSSSTDGPKSLPSGLIGRSILGGPPPAPSERAAVPTKAEGDTVVVSLPGVTKAQVTGDLLHLLADLSDHPPGQATAIWAGDLLTVHVKPVADPARFATKIRFGRVIFYSGNDRALTVQLSEEQSAQLNDPTRDPLTGILANLKQREDAKKIHEALTSLRGRKSLDRQAEVSAALEAVAGQNELDQNLRAEAVKLLPGWSGRDCVSLLQRLLDDTSALVTWAALDALVELKSVTSAAVMAQHWGKAEPARVTRALIALGPEVEPVVLPYLNNTKNPLIKIEACKVLQEIGTGQSLKPLLDVVNEKDQSKPVLTAAKEAMKSILERK